MSAFLETDANQKISADRAPAMRFAMVQVGEQACELVWSFHPDWKERIDIGRAIDEFTKECGTEVRVEERSAERSPKPTAGNGGIRSGHDSTAKSGVESLASESEDVERKLLSLWETVLEVSPLHADDDFWNSGGHSLLAARLMARVEDLFGVELPLAMLLDAPTVRGQARLIHEYLNKKNAPPTTQGEAEVRVEIPGDDKNQAALPPAADGETPKGEGDVEAKLISVWEEVLKVSPIDLHDDFFDCGGHSVLATRLLIRIEDVLGVELPLASLLEASTIHRQAQLIRKQLGKPNTDRLATEQSPQHQNTVAHLPFFFFGGDPTFRPLSQRLRELRELQNLGMQTSILSKVKDPYSLECLAGYFAETIRQRCREGPYMVAGWCAHGLLAYETARQLREQGQEVAIVVLLESAHPVKRLQSSRWKWPISRAQYKIHLLKFERAYLKQLDAAQARDYIARRAAKKLRRIKESSQRIFRFGTPQKHGDVVSAEPIDVLYAAAARYRPHAYDGRVVLVRCQQRTFGFAQQLDLGWSELLGKNLEIVQSPGNHYTMYMPPNVDTLTLKINVCLRRAEELATTAH